MTKKNERAYFYLAMRRFVNSINGTLLILVVVQFEDE